MYKQLYKLFPRQIGIPFRITCNNASEFYSIINEHKTTHRVFASVYNYNSNQSYIDQFLELDKVYFDIDGLTSDIREEVKQFSTKLIEEDIKHLVIFSGGGFHIYLWTCNYQNIDSKKSTLFNIHKHIINEYALTHVDPAVVGDIARLATIPGTFNFKRRSFAIPVTVDEIDTVEPTLQQRVLSDEYIVGKRLFDISEFNSHERIYDYIEESFIPDMRCHTDMDVFSILPSCLQSILLEAQQGKYVGTYSRMLFIVYLRDNGIPVGNIVELFKKYLIGKRGGRTEWQHCLHEKQIEFIYSKSSQYSFPDCDLLKKKNMCFENGYCNYVKKYCDGKRVLKIYK